MQCTADGRRLSVVTKFGECAIWELDTDGYKVSSVRLPPFEQSAPASSNPKAAMVTDKGILAADLVSGLKVDLPVDASNLMLICPQTGRPTRVGVRYLPDGSKERYSKRSGASMGRLSKPRKAYAQQ